jgi:hypothetical protein
LHKFKVFKRTELEFIEKVFDEMAAIAVKSVYIESMMEE